MKVKLNDLREKFFDITATSLFLNNIYSTVGSIINQWLIDDLTVIGNWSTIDECFDFVKRRVTNYALSNINFLNSYDLENIDFDAFILSSAILDNKNVTNETTTIEGNSGYIREDSPITYGENYTINTPSEKNKSISESERTHTKDNTNIKDNIERLKFLEKYKSVYAIFENLVLSLTEEFTTVY